MSFSILTLFTPETATRILNTGLALAQIVGLPVTSWRTGDPTRALYKFLATKLAAVDLTVANLARSAVLSVLAKAAETDSAALAWLKIVALEQWGVTVVEATFATSAAGAGVVLENTGGGNYPIAPGDITFKSTNTNKTYHNTTGGTLAPGPGTTLLLEFVADEAGSDSTVAADEIDEMVTTKLGVVIQSSAAAVGLDEESPQSVHQRCKDSLAALSPNGPEDVYRYVALNAALTGITSVTRAESVGNENGTVTVYIANASGGASGGEVTAVQTAIDKWATPNCVTATVGAASGVTVPLAADVAYAGSLSDAEFETAVASGYAAALAALRIGGAALTSGDRGVALDLIVTTIRAIDGVTAVTLTDPTEPVELTPNQVAVPGTVDITVV